MTPRINRSLPVDYVKHHKPARTAGATDKTRDQKRSAQQAANARGPRYIKSNLSIEARIQFLHDKEKVKISRDKTEIARLLKLCGQIGNGEAMRKELEAL